MDPVSQAQLWCPMDPYPWQQKILADCIEIGAKVAAVTPNESGKTSMVIPALGLAWMAAFPGSQVASTSGAERQIKEQLWPVLRAALSKHPKWTMSDDELTIDAPSIRGLPGSTWKAFSPRDPKTAEGFHDRWYKDEEGNNVYAPLLIITDEAKGITDEMFFALRRCGPAVWLVVSTPGEDTGPFWNIFNKWRNEWRVHEVGWADCTHLMKGHKYEERLALIRQYGEDDPYIQSMIYGKFFRAGGRVVFDRWDCVDYAMSGLVPWKRGERRCAVDLSGGGDKQVAGIRDGNALLDKVEFRHKDSTVLVSDLVKFFRKWELRPDQIVADNGGLGAPIIDQLGAKGWPVLRYQGNAPARDKSAYMDRASEDAFHLRQLIAERSISLLRDEDLREQMRKRRYDRKNDNSNRVKLESKVDVRRRGEPSPDDLDMVTMLYAELPQSLYTSLSNPLDAIRSARCGAATDCFKKDDGFVGVWGGNRFED
jgi:hypothetical protein